MEYPSNGSIVVIDDNINEVSGLLRALSSKGAPVYYLNGEVEEIPYIDNIKLIFLDLDLGVDGDDVQKISKLMLVLNKLVQKSNGDYIIMAWSSLIKNLYRKLLIAILSDCKNGNRFINKKPFAIKRVSKQDITNSDGDPDLTIIKDKMDQAIGNDSIKNLFMLWENIVKESSSQVIKNLEKISDKEEKTKSLVASFANAIAHIDATTSKKDIVNYSLIPLSNLLTDQLSKRTSEIDMSSLDEISKQILEIAKKRVQHSSEIASKINTFYHIDNSPSCNYMPGNVYFYRDYIEKSDRSGNCGIKWAAELEEKFAAKAIKVKNNIFDEEFDGLTPPKQSKVDGKDKYRLYRSNQVLKEESIPIFMEISADCDYVQNNRKKLRLIFGELIPAKYKLTKNSDSIIGISPDVIIEYNEEPYWIILDTHLVTAVDSKVFEKTAARVSKLNNVMVEIKETEEIQARFRFRKEFVVDVQHKVASHFSRPGFFNMADYS